MAALYSACCLGDLVRVRSLLDDGADLHQGNDSMLLCACRKGHVEVIKLLLDRGAEVDRVDSNGFTALGWACRKGHVEVIKLLLDRGAKVDRAGSDGSTALRRACHGGHVEVVKLLLEHGASPDLTALPGLPFTDPTKAILHQWSTATPARRVAVCRHGWEYVEVPYRWTPQNHAQFPADFRHKAGVLCMAWRAPLAALGQDASQLAELATEAYHGEAMGLR
jgi:hypothetical protein